MEPLDLSRVIKFAENLGASEVELIWVFGENTLILGTKDKIDSGKYSKGGSFGVRAVVGKRIGFAGGTVQREEDFMKIVEKAVKVAKVSPEDPDWVSLPRGLGKAKGVEIYDKKIEEISEEELMEITLRGLETVKGYSKETFPIGAQTSASRTLYQISNSYGEEVHTLGTMFVISVGVRAKEGERVGSYFDSEHSRRFSELDPEDLAKKASKRAVDSMKAKRIETGKYDLILEGKIGGKLLASVLFPAMSAENVQKNRSPLKGKLGEQILSEDVNFIEDPYRSWDPGSRPFDGEGKETKRYYLVRKGTLETYYYDDYTARKEGKESTGNAHRGVSTRPSPWINNVIFEPGESSLEELVQETKKGVLVCSSIGYWLSNPVSGQMSGTISHGYVIENGEIVGVVKGVTFADNVYEAMKDRLEGIGKELERSGSVVCPPYKFSGVTLAGDRNLYSHSF